MTKIKNQLAYKVKSIIKPSDFVVGSVGEISDGFSVGQTVSYTWEDVLQYIQAGLSPVTGGTLKITEIEYEGVETNVVTVANALSPAYTVAQYELVFLSINGDKYVLIPQDVTIGTGQTALSSADFITIVAFLKLGIGQSIFKGINLATGKQEYYGVTSTGLDISVVDSSVNFESKAGTNLGDGTPIYKGLNDTTKIDEFYNLKSDTLNISKEMAGSPPTETGNLLIEIPSTSNTPLFYVNSGYDIGGTAPENGSPSKPYKTISAAKTAYIGTGTAKAPQFTGEIIIQKGAGVYSYVGDFAINGVTIRLETGTIIESNPTNGWLVDLDDTGISLATDKFEVTIIRGEDSEIRLLQSGFRNSGTTTNNSAFLNYKTIYIKGSGKIRQTELNAVTLAHVVFDSNSVNTANYYNDSSSPFVISDGVISSETQPIFNSGGYVNNTIDNVTFGISNPGVSVSANLKPFYLTGGNIFMSGCDVSVLVSGLTLFTFSKSSTIPCSLTTQNCTITGNITTLYKNLTAEKPSLTVLNCGTTSQLNVTNLFISTSVLWNTILFNFNTITSITNDFSTEADLTTGNTISVINKIGTNILESLRIFASRALAVAGNLPKGSAFISRRVIPQNELVLNTEYQIQNLGTVNWTAIGASLSSVGVNFIYNGVSVTGSGGTVYFWSRDTLI